MIIYVAASAYRDGNGSKERPFKRISDAAKLAGPGDEVLVARGVYREYVDPVRGGGKREGLPTAVRKPLGAVITGAGGSEGWAPYQGDVWVCRVGNHLFGNYNRILTYVYGDWYFAGRSKHTGAVSE